MRKLASLAVFLTLILTVFPCTNILVTRGATADGSTMIAYVADSHTLYGALYFTPARDHIPGETVDVYEWDTGKYLMSIPQVAHTYRVVGFMNEHQVSIGETTFGGRHELRSKVGIDYGSLMFLALQRAKTAREAIKVMTSLVEKYGYYSEGESFSIADPREVWILEMVGKGKEKGAVWVACRVPDGYISAHANQSRIRKFPLHDPDKCIYSRDVISFARKMGYFKGRDEDFSFADAYAPVDFGGLRFCEARVWDIFRRVAPSLQLPDDYIKGNPDAKPLPLWIKPKKKLTVRDVISLLRSHFEGTDLDMTRDVGAGPFKLPYRWRPLVWKYNGKKYFNERAISTQQTGFSFVAHMRSWLPAPIGGVFWFGVDDTYSNVYVPFYAGIRSVPRAWSVEGGDFSRFSWDSAFWVFNFVANYAYSRYCDMIKDIQKVQWELEGRFFAEQKEVETTAMALYKQAPGLARDYLTRYSHSQATYVLRRWKKLGEFLIWKYLDGNVKDEFGGVTHPGYPKEWYKRIVEETGDKFLYREKKKE